MYNKLLKKIQEYEYISVFRHVRPDGDSAFSSLAMYYFLKENFPEKKIKIGGNEKYDIVSKNDIISDNFIKKSLAIVLDTATDERVDDFRCMAAEYIVKIDHHPPVQNYGDLNIVKPDYSSACELLADIFFSKVFSKYKYSNRIYEYLYCGMVTDTLNFKTANTTYKTLNIASKLVEKGSLKPSDLYEYLNDVDISTFRKINIIRNQLKVVDNFGYIKLDSKQLKKLNLDPVEAKNNIDEIGKIKELNIWAFAVENNNGWDCSMRSKRQYTINQIATKYTGGGHPNACAVKHVKLSDIDSMFKELALFSKKRRK